MSRTIWIEIYDEPVRVLCFDRADLDGLVDPRLARHEILDTLSELRAGAGSDETPEVANFSATTKNKAGQTSRLFKVPPFGAAALMKVNDARGTRTLFSGVVQGLQLLALARWTFQS